MPRVRIAVLVLKHKQIVEQLALGRRGTFGSERVVSVHIDDVVDPSIRQRTLITGRHVGGNAVDRSGGDLGLVMQIDGALGQLKRVPNRTAR